MMKKEFCKNIYLIKIVNGHWLNINDRRAPKTDLTKLNNNNKKTG